MIKRIIKLFSPTRSEQNTEANHQKYSSHAPSVHIPEEWKPFLDEIERSNGHFFVTGYAGAGKSTFIREFCRITKKNAVITAPTGFGAFNAGGVTTHSFARLPSSVITGDNIREIPEKQLIRAVDAIIIDDVSMARCDLLDGLDNFMRKNGRDATAPFGGVQVILVGDPYQLCPEVTDDEKETLRKTGCPGPYYFWNAKVYPEIRPQSIKLTGVYKGAEDSGIMKALNCIRNNDMDNAKLDAFLQECVAEPDFDPFSRPYHTMLTPRNAEATYYNNKMFHRLSGAQKEYRAKRSGSALNINNPEDNFPCEENLPLRPGTRVIFCKTIDSDIANGTLGTVVDLEDASVTVKTDDGRSVKVTPSLWELVGYSCNTETGRVETKVTGWIEQIPLRHAWALSLQKSQGVLFDKIHIDLEDESFLQGQAYIALSRCRALAGISLKNYSAPKDIMIDRHIVDFVVRNGL